MGYCDAFSRKFNISERCCESCHEDYDLGLDYLIDVDIEKGFYRICCQINREYKKKDEGRIIFNEQRRSNNFNDRD